MRIRMAVTLLGIVLMTGPAMADVTITATQQGKGMMAKLMTGEAITRIKGGKMRGDTASGDAPTTTLIDLDAQMMAVLNHKAKEATVTDLSELQASMGKMTNHNIKATVTPTGRRQEVAGRGCDEYQMDMTVPAFADPSSPIMVNTSGPVCIVKDSPGKADYAAFYLKAAEKGFVIAGDPRQAKAQPGQARSMTEVYRQMARLGVPYLVELDFKMGGEGPMGALMGRLGFGFTSTVTRVSVEAIPDALMAVPADYKVKKN
jgi:Domain of unknown function (DUF4412)